MAEERRSLTGPQAEVMEAVWAAGDAGATVGEIWDTLAARREIARTTVATTVQRLERSGWLRREFGRRGDTWFATRQPDAVRQAIAKDVVDRWFDGSAAKLVQCLLGGRRPRKDEIERLRALLRDVEAER